MPRTSGSLRMSIITRFLDGASAMMSVRSCTNPCPPMGECLFHLE